MLYKLYKPAGYLSQFTHQHTHRKNKKMLGELYDFPPGTMAIGRLDENTEGLLLLTTDGKLSYEINSQKYEKEYYAQVDGIVTEEHLIRLREGLDISINGTPYRTKPCEARLIPTPHFPPGHKIRDERHGPTSWVSITVREGKYRQIRKMTAAVGLPTLRLVRVRVDQFDLKGMIPGDVNVITDFNPFL